MTSNKLLIGSFANVFYLLVLFADQGNSGFKLLVKHFEVNFVRVRVFRREPHNEFAYITKIFFALDNLVSFQFLFLVASGEEFLNRVQVDGYHFEFFVDRREDIKRFLLDFLEKLFHDKDILLIDSHLAFDVADFDFF